MKYRYRSDEEMKDSGVEWIGKIPKDWEVSKNRYIFSLKRKEINESDDTTVLSLTTTGIKVKKNLSFGKSTESYIGHQLVYPGDLVFTPRDFDQTPILSGVSEFYGCISNLYFVLKCKDDIVNRFVNYFWWGLKYKVNFFKNFSYGIRYSYNYDQFKELLFLNPMYNEQVKIADFLDEKTSNFDNIISKKEKLIEKLEEAKKSLISEVVTGKVKVVKNGDDFEILKREDSEMKDSGVEWIGKIPKDWEVKRIKYSFDIKKNIAGELGYDVLSVTQSGIKIKDITKNGGQLSMDYSKYQIVEIDDFIMNHMDLLTGFVDCSKFKGVTSPDYRVFRLKDYNNCKEYYNYILQSCYYNRIFYSLARGVSGMGRWRLQTETFKNFIVPMPKIEEQERIAKFIFKKTNDIDILKNKLKINIEKLKEAKQALISEAVTGKIEILD